MHVRIVDTLRRSGPRGTQVVGWSGPSLCQAKQVTRVCNAGRADGPRTFLGYVWPRLLRRFKGVPWLPC